MQSIAMLEQINMCYDEFRRRLDKALKQPDEVIDKIKEFINELEHNKQVDKDANIDISAVACDYVIEKLKDIKPTSRRIGMVIMGMRLIK